ncbi:Mu-like prophage major head subunit gpT family protein [Mesorhizobium sp. M0522]|uniref:phage major capsid protein n=1 Tax=Mesorhizobium sp. M0522 TaxID=2956958 RepID=UPI003336B289
MKKASFSAAVAMILCAGLILGLGAEAAHALPHLSMPISHEHFNFSDHVLHASVALAGLRSKLADLTTKAEKKIGEIKDDTSPEAARTIQTEHAGLLAEIDQVRAQIRTAEEEETRRNAPPAPDTATRAADIVGIAAAARAAGAEVSTEDEQTAIRTNVEPATFRAQMFDRLAARSSQNRTDPARITQDERETRRNAMTEALSYGLGAPIPQAGPSAAARGFMGRGLIDLAAQCIDYRGGLVMNARQIDDILTRAGMHSTSDFPIIFENAVNHTLEGRYALAQPTFRRIARKQNFRDFRPHTTVKLGDFPMLQKVLETGEIKYGTFNEGKETVQAFSYAIAISVSRQMLINDDIGAIADLLSSYGASVALFEEVMFYSTAFNANLADGNPVFHASHGNLAAAGTVIDVTNVGKARAAMSKQKSLGGNQLLENRARILLVGPDKLTEAEMLLASITPATVANVNIFSGKLEPVDTAQVTGNAWYTFADPSTGSNYRWGYLEGYEAPRVRMDEPFGKQGFAMSVEHDFGVGATDYRFGYKNPGA